MKIPTDRPPTQVQIAALLGISERTVRSLIAQGHLTKGALAPRLVSEYVCYRTEICGRG